MHNPYVMAVYFQDLSHNNISVVYAGGSFLETGTLNQAARLSSLKLSHQRSPARLTVAHADCITSTSADSLCFSTVKFFALPFVPSSEFKMHEYPQGSGVYPFACPIFGEFGFCVSFCCIPPPLTVCCGGSRAQISRHDRRHRPDCLFLPRGRVSREQAPVDISLRHRRICGSFHCFLWH